MSLLKYVERFKRMHQLIKTRSTGSPENFARKLNISRSVLMDNLKDLRELGADIRYSSVHQSYYYDKEFPLVIGVNEREKWSAVQGGINFFKDGLPGSCFDEELVAIVTIPAL